MGRLAPALVSVACRLWLWCMRGDSVLLVGPRFEPLRQTVATPDGADTHALAVATDLGSVHLSRWQEIRYRLRCFSWTICRWMPMFVW